MKPEKEIDKLSNNFIQPQVEIGDTDNEYEKKSNEIADSGMRMSEDEQMPKMNAGSESIKMRSDAEYSIKMADPNEGKIRMMVDYPMNTQRLSSYNQVKGGSRQNDKDKFPQNEEKEISESLFTGNFDNEPDNVVRIPTLGERASFDLRKKLLKLSVFNLHGDLVKTFNPNSNNEATYYLDGNIPAGVYILVFYLEDGSKEPEKILKGLSAYAVEGETTFSIKVRFRPLASQGSLLSLFYRYDDKKISVSSIPHSEIMTTNEFKEYIDPLGKWGLLSSTALFACHRSLISYSEGNYDKSVFDKSGNEAKGNNRPKSAKMFLSNDTYVDGKKELHFWVQVPEGEYIKDYVVVQWIKGFAKSGSEHNYAYYITDMYGSEVDINFADWQVDSTDTDPVYGSGVLKRWKYNPLDDWGFYQGDSPISLTKADVGAVAKLDFKVELFKKRDVPLTTSGDLGGAESKALRSIPWKYYVEVTDDQKIKYDSDVKK